MFTPYEGSSTEERVVLHHNGTGSPRTYSVPQNHFPTTGWQLAQLMNGAYINGYKQAQREARAAIGIKE
jgi:hypothetical protein